MEIEEIDQSSHYIKFNVTSEKYSRALECSIYSDGDLYLGDNVYIPIDMLITLSNAMKIKGQKKWGREWLNRE